MTRKPLTRSVAKTLVLATAVAFVLSAKPARAQLSGPEAPQLCMTNLSNCYYWAAVQYGFWTMWAGGIDCELAMIDCVRRALIGR